MLKILTKSTILRKYKPTAISFYYDFIPVIKKIFYFCIKSIQHFNFITFNYMKKILLSLLAAFGILNANADTFTITSSEIVSGKTGSVELAVNGYGKQAVATDSTWYTFAKGDYSFTAVKIATASAGNGGGIQLQGNASDTSKQGLIANTTAFGNISSITITARVVLTNTNAPAFNVYVGASKMPTATTLKADTVKTADETYTTYKMTYAVTGSNGFFMIKNDKVGALYIDDITVNYGSTTAKEKASADLKWSVASVAIKQGEKFTAPTFSKATTAKVTFTSSDDEVAAVSEDGVITLGDQLGTTTITATCDANDDFDKGTATCTIEVYNIQEVTCAEASKIALALTSNGNTTQRYTVTGYVTETNGTVSKNQQTFWMADTKDGGKVFEGYWANLPEPYEALTVGTKITMTGFLTKYNTTAEMKNGTVVILEKSTEKIDTIVATAAQAYAIGAKLESGATTKEFYDITAYVDSITYKYSSGSQSFTLTDTKGVKGDSLIAYKAAIKEAALVGAKVRIIGKITNYKGVIEIAQGGQCTILEQGVDAAIREITATKDDDNAIYNLAGQKVGKNYKGVIIKGGKKYIQK